MRDCGSCGECCHGRLTFNDVSKTGEEIIVSDSIPCFKLVDENCSIHEDRPDVCRNWQCVWTLDEGLPEWLQPSQCGFMIWKPDEICTDYCIVPSDHVQVNIKALLWTLWWANQTGKNMQLMSIKYGDLLFKNS